MQITKEEKFLVECFLSEQMSIKQFYQHCKENPKLLEIIKQIGGNKYAKLSTLSK